MGAFMAHDSGTPDPVADFTVEPLGHNLRLDFQGGGGTYGYMALAAKSEEALRKTRLSMLDTGIEFAHLVIGDVEAPVAPRSIELLSLEPDTDYYVSIAAYSYGRRYSDLAPIKKVHTRSRSSIRTGTPSRWTSRPTAGRRSRPRWTGNGISA